MRVQNHLTPLHKIYWNIPRPIWLPHPVDLLAVDELIGGGAYL